MTEPIGAWDEVFHPAGADQHWNESAWFGFSIPERDINGFVYFFHDARTGASGGGPALWDPSGEQTYDCLFYDWRWRQPLTGPLEFADFVLPNTLRHQVIEPMHRYRLSYNELGLELDLEWASLMSPHEIGHSASSADTGRHFDQPGRMSGAVVLDGERLTSTATRCAIALGARIGRAHGGPGIICGRSHRRRSTGMRSRWPRLRPAQTR